jgi:hypothetical protein
MSAKAGVALSLLAVTSCPLPAAAHDTLDSVLARMQVSETRSFHYRETRHLALLAKPWEASGEMYIAPDRLLIVQQEPEPGITDITRSRLLHIDPEHHVVRTMELASPFGVQGLEPFLQLLYGKSAGSALQKRYATTFKVDKARWQLNLYPVLEHSGAISQMWLAGDEGRGADYLEVEFEDEDRTEYRLSMTDRGEPARQAMQRVIERAEQ